MQTQNSMQKCHFKELFGSSFMNNFRKDLPVRCTMYTVYASSGSIIKSTSFLMTDSTSNETSFLILLAASSAMIIVLRSFYREI